MVCTTIYQQPATTVRPAADVYESSEAFSVLVDVPGVEPDGIDIQIHQGHLRVSGKPADEAVSTAFQRSFRLSKNIDVEGIQAQLERGTLTLTLPKKQEAQPRQIKLS